MDIATVEELLSTTRSVRRRLDLTRTVEPEILEWAIALALQAPTGSNAQTWRFLVVTDAEKRRAIGEIYRETFERYAKGLVTGPNPYPASDPRHDQYPRVMSSAAYLAEILGRVPVHVIAAVEGRVEEAGVTAQATLYGSILPAAWSLMLALRARGIGATWTTLHLVREREIAEILGIPENVTQAALLPIAYYRGESFHPGRRVPPAEVTYWEAWGRKR